LVIGAPATLAFCPRDGGSDEFLRRLRRLGPTALQLGDARQQRLVLLLKIVDPRQQRPVLLDQNIELRHQRQHQPLQAVSVERIDPLGRHPELESAAQAARNRLRVSQTDAEG
jgi:hypothetical protein